MHKAKARCEKISFRRLQQAAAGADPLAESAQAGLSHARGVLAQVNLQGGPVAQPVMHAVADVPRFRRRFQPFEDFGPGEAGAKPRRGRVKCLERCYNGRLPAVADWATEAC